MNKLKYFLLGMFVADIGLGLAESVAGILLQKCEVEKGKLQVQVAKLRNEYEAQMQPQETSSNAIGFSIEPVEEIEEEESEEEDE